MKTILRLFSNILTAVMIYLLGLGSCALAQTTEINTNTHKNDVLIQQLNASFHITFLEGLLINEPEQAYQHFEKLYTLAPQKCLAVLAGVDQERRFELLLANAELAAKLLANMAVEDKGDRLQASSVEVTNTGEAILVSSVSLLDWLIAKAQAIDQSEEKPSSGVTIFRSIYSSVPATTPDTQPSRQIDTVGAIIHALAGQYLTKFVDILSELQLPMFQAVQEFIDAKPLLTFLEKVSLDDEKQLNDYLKIIGPSRAFSIAKMQGTSTSLRNEIVDFYSKSSLEDKKFFQYMLNIADIDNPSDSAFEDQGWFLDLKDKVLHKTYKTLLTKYPLAAVLYFRQLYMRSSATAIGLLDSLKDDEIYQTLHGLYSQDITSFDQVIVQFANILDAKTEGYKSRLLNRDLEQVSKEDIRIDLQLWLIRRGISNTGSIDSTTQKMISREGTADLLCDTDGKGQRHRNIQFDTETMSKVIPYLNKNDRVILLQCLEESDPAKFKASIDGVKTDGHCQLLFETWLLLKDGKETISKACYEDINEFTGKWTTEQIYNQIKNDP